MSGLPQRQAVLRERDIAFLEININSEINDEEPNAEDVVLKVNQGGRMVPTIKVGERYFACAPFGPYPLASELNIPLNI